MSCSDVRTSDPSTAAAGNYPCLPRSVKLYSENGVLNRLSTFKLGDGQGTLFIVPKNALSLNSVLSPMVHCGIDRMM